MQEFIDLISEYKEMMEEEVVVEDIEVSVDFEISLDLEGKISVNVNGEEYDLPEFEAGSTLNIQEEIDNIILQIETTLSQTITFN